MLNHKLTRQQHYFTFLQEPDSSKLSREYLIKSASITSAEQAMMLHTQTTLALIQAEKEYKEVVNNCHNIFVLTCLFVKCNIYHNKYFLCKWVFLTRDLWHRNTCWRRTPCWWCWLKSSPYMTVYRYVNEFFLTGDLWRNKYSNTCL